MKFTWHEGKNKENIKKHGISFFEAKSLFYDDNALIFSDEYHSQNEERFIIVGISSFGTSLLSCFCERGENNEIIRIISARKLTRKEKKDLNKEV